MSHWQVPDDPVAQVKVAAVAKTESLITTRAGHSRGVLGVLGGMGPAATADFYRKLVEATPAVRDQDHIPVLVVSDPRIDDRSRAIETGAAAEVLAQMLGRLRYLEQARVDAIAMPCNTAHYWLASLRQETSIPFISLIEASAAAARRLHPGGGTALVLGTRSMVRSRIYDAELERVGFAAVTPTQEQQARVDIIISRVKAGVLDVAAAELEAGAEEWSKRADVVILACTELPLAAQKTMRSHPTFIDTTAALVNACIAWAAAFSARTSTATSTVGGI